MQHIAGVVDSEKVLKILTNGELLPDSYTRYKYSVQHVLFQREYLSLVEKCMNFACELMDLCRGTQEVEAVLSEGSDCSSDNGKRDPLARLKMAIRYQEKKVRSLLSFMSL